MVKVVKRSSQIALVSYLCLFMLTGCGTFRVEVENPVSPVQFQSPVMDRIAITVIVPPDQFKANGEEGVAPLNNRDKFQHSLARSLEQNLTASGVSKGVVASPSGGSWTMSVTGKWNSKWSWSEYTWELIKVTFSVLLLMIPFFFMTESFTARTQAGFTLTDPSGLERGRGSVQSTMDIDVAVVRSSIELLDGMFTVPSDDLANRIVLELKRHPHWFEPVR